MQPGATISRGRDIGELASQAMIRTTFTLLLLGLALAIVTSDRDSVFSGGSRLPPKATSTRVLSQTLGGRTDLSQARGFWIRISANVPFAAGGLQTLEVGGQTLLPYGVLDSPPCRRMSVLLNESGNLTSALALLNPAPTESSCKLQAYRGTQGEIASAEIMLPGLHADSFFVSQRLQLGMGFQGAARSPAQTRRRSILCFKTR